MKKSNLILGIAACVFAVSSMAASDGIRKNRTNECAAWLCVPGGFPSGCEAAYSAFIGRITDYTSGRHPKRKYTDLPNIKNSSLLVKSVTYSILISSLFSVIIL